MPTTTLLVAHPKPVIRAGLRSMLTDSQVKIVGEAGDAPSALTLANKNKPTVVLIDAAIPGGDAFELAGGLLKALPATKVVFVTEIDNPTYTARARAASAANCLLMGFSQRELLAAIESAAAGRPAAGAGNFGRITASLAAREKGPALNAGLTPREGQVLAHVAFG